MLYHQSTTASDSIITSITWLLYPSASIVSLCVPTGNSDVSMVISVSFTVVSSSSSPYLTEVIAFRYSALPFSVHSFPRWILSCPVSFGASLSSAGGTISEPSFRTYLPLPFFTAVRVMVSYPSASTTISTVSPVNPVSTVIRRQSLMRP